MTPLLAMKQVPLKDRAQFELFFVLEHYLRKNERIARQKRRRASGSRTTLPSRERQSHPGRAPHREDLPRGLLPPLPVKAASRSSSTKQPPTGRAYAEWSFDAFKQRFGPENDQARPESRAVGRRLHRRTRVLRGDRVRRVPRSGIEWRTRSTCAFLRCSRSSRSWRRISTRSSCGNVREQLGDRLRALTSVERHHHTAAQCHDAVLLRERVRHQALDAHPVPSIWRS